MANEEQVAILKQGVKVWNKWRGENPDVRIDLSAIDLSKAELAGDVLWDSEYLWATLWEADLRDAVLTGANLGKANLWHADLMRADLRGAILTEADLSGANLRKADLTQTNLTTANLISAALIGADLTGANLGEANLTTANLWKANLTTANLTQARLEEVNLWRADLRKADMRGANLYKADLWKADLTEADLRGANLTEANLTEADLRKADLTEADLTAVQLIETRLEGAILTDCRVYGISAWNVLTNTETVQRNLIITPEGQPGITVNNLKVAQFMYLIINNKEIRDVIDTIRSKVVLILGRFNDENKPRLDRLREALSSLRDANGQQRYIPVMFDFDRPQNATLLEPVITLAHMSRFVIADFTDSKLVEREVTQIYGPAKVPLLPLLREDSHSHTIDDLRQTHRQVLPVHRYRDDDDLLANLETMMNRAESSRSPNAGLSKAKRLNNRFKPIR